MNRKLRWQKISNFLFINHFYGTELHIHTELFSFEIYHSTSPVFKKKKKTNTKGQITIVMFDVRQAPEFCPFITLAEYPATACY